MSGSGTLNNDGYPRPMTTFSLVKYLWPNWGTNSIQWKFLRRHSIPIPLDLYPTQCPYLFHLIDSIASSEIPTNRYDFPPLNAYNYPFDVLATTLFICVHRKASPRLTFMFFSQDTARACYPDMFYELGSKPSFVYLQSIAFCTRASLWRQ